MEDPKDFVCKFIDFDRGGKKLVDAMLTYIKKNSPIDKLTGATKLICFIFWTLAAMLTYDTRVLIGMLIFSLIIFKVSKIEFKEVSFYSLFYIILFTFK